MPLWLVIVFVVVAAIIGCIVGLILSPGTKYSGSIWVVKDGYMYVELDEEAEFKPGERVTLVVRNKKNHLDE